MSDMLARISAIRSGAQDAAAWVSGSLSAMDRATSLNCFTTVLPHDAVRQAAAIDATGRALPLAGMPFAVKDLYDVAGHVTLAGARVNRIEGRRAAKDATLVARLRAAGAVLVGMTNMDEYAYGFSTENSHFGPTRNPHDPGRIAGGSSGGSAAAVAAGLVPVALGSDTNGSIRVPASLCGIYGLKPTYGRLSRAGVFPFVASLDHAGLFAATPADLAAAFDQLQGSDPRDPACTRKAPALTLPGIARDAGTVRVGLLDGWFRQDAAPEALAAVDHVASAFSDVRRVTLEGAAAARSAAFCMSAMEGGDLHAERLRTHYEDFDPAVRDRLLAGLLMPASLSLATRRVRRLFAREVARIFAQVDILISPATPCAAPGIGQNSIVINGRDVPVRANLGLYTQPISFIGLPALSVPAAMPGLPIGVQVIGRAWSEPLLLQIAAMLERRGTVRARLAGPAPARLDRERTEKA